MRIILFHIPAWLIFMAANTMAFAQQAPESAPEGPPPPPDATSQPLPDDAPIYEPGPNREAPPPADEWTKAYPGGKWVYTDEYGWLWIPDDAATIAIENIPYVYLYTPFYGWTWYVSPWGPGSFFFGPWVRHAWHPAGWHGGWIAHPRVIALIPHGRAGLAHSGSRGRRR